MNGHELQAIFDTWSVHSKEHGEVITNENVSGFVQDVRKAIAAGASEGQASRLQRAVWEVERPDHDGFYWLWRISYKGERMPAEIVQRHQGDFLFPGDSKAFAANSTVFVGAYWLPACIAPQPDASAELTTLRERIAGMEKDAREHLQSLRDDISAIDTWYRGDPSYEHDAYWFKDRVLCAFDERIAAIAKEPK